MKFSPESLNPLPSFSWKAVERTPALATYLHFYRLDKALNYPDSRHCFGTVEAAGLTLLVQAFIRESHTKNVFLLHGYTDHVGLFDQLICHLMEKGFNVVSLDLPGHGLTVSGHRAGIDGFGQYQDAVAPIIEMAQKEFPGDWYLIGQSTGGAIAMDYIMNNPPHGFKKQILLAPLVIPARWAWVKVQLFVLRSFLNTVPRTFSTHTSDKDFLKFLRRDPLQTRTIHTSWVQSLYDWQEHFAQSPQSATPTLLVQGDQDSVVDGPYNRDRLREKFTHLTEVLITGANHHLVNEEQSLRAQVFNHVERYLAD